MLFRAGSPSFKVIHVLRISYYDFAVCGTFDIQSLSCWFRHGFFYKLKHTNLIEGITSLDFTRLATLTSLLWSHDEGLQTRFYGTKNLL